MATEIHYAGSIDRILCTFTGTAEECDAIRQTARDYDWGGEPLTDVGGAVESAMSEWQMAIEGRGGEVNDQAWSRLRAALLDSAEKCAVEVES